MRLAIVGSAVLADSEAAVRAVIAEALERWQPTAVVSGGAPGVDAIAEAMARERGLTPIIHRPRGRGWPAYQARNRLIARDADRLLRIVSRRSRTYGSGWTRDLAARLGTPTDEVVLA